MDGEADEPDCIEMILRFHCRTELFQHGQIEPMDTLSKKMRSSFNDHLILGESLT